MSTRRAAREWALQLLYQREFNRDDEAGALAGFWAHRAAPEKGRRFALELYHGVVEHAAEIDGRLQGYAENWDLKRMSAVDRNILRMALFEMIYRLDIPPVVTINEAVDIAKDFSGLESGRFVNGILDRARKDQDRPSRSPAPAPDGVA